MIDFDKEMQSVIEFAKDTFLKRGKLMPMVIGITDEGGKCVVGLAFDNDNIKKISIIIAKKYMRKQNVTAIAFMTEIWYRTAKARAISPNMVRPMYCADRREAIMVSLIMKDRRASAIMDVIRTGHKIDIATATTTTEFEDNLWDDYFQGKGNVFGVDGVATPTT